MMFVCGFLLAVRQSEACRRQRQTHQTQEKEEKRRYSQMIKRNKGYHFNPLKIWRSPMQFEKVYMPVKITSKSMNMIWFGYMNMTAIQRYSTDILPCILPASLRDYSFILNNGGIV